MKIRKDTMASLCCVTALIWSGMSWTAPNDKTKEEKELKGAIKKMTVPFLFDLSPDQVRQACQKGVEKADKNLSQITSQDSEKVNFRSSVLALDGLLAELDLETSVPIFLKYTSPDEAVRNAGHECELKIDEYLVGLFANASLYNVLESFSKSEESRALNPVDKRLLEKTLRDFRENGFGLGDEKRAKVTELKKELSKLQAEFSRNLLEYEDHLALSEEELKGLPKDFVDRLEKTAQGKYKITLSYPDYFPFMENAQSAQARKNLEYKFDNKAVDKNIALLEEALKLREEVAELLGYHNHAEYVLEERMAKTPKNVRGFLADLKERLQMKAREELALLLELKKEDEPNAKDIRSWDFAYYVNQLKKRRYELDKELIKTYFPLPVVTAGMFEIYQKILDVVFTEVKDPKAWHPDVQLYTVSDRKDGELIGYFYMDLFPRDGKYGHAAAFTLRKGRKMQDGTYQKPVSALVANFGKPTKDRPSLLFHGEVETYFHEFGHIMHQLLTTADHYRFSGTAVARDFVEAPSQMLENWVWESEILEKISGHYENPKNKLPPELRKRMIEAKNAIVGLKYLRQVFFATMDLTYHTTEMPIDTTESWHKLQKEIALIEAQEGTHRQAGFGHFMGGYDAGYYGYLWSEVFAADMFTRFEKEGVTNRKVGADYRKYILEPGGSVEAESLLKSFLGREPNKEAFFRSIGIGKGKSK